MLAEKIPRIARRRAARDHRLGHGSVGLVVLSQLEPGDHVIVSKHLYGPLARATDQRSGAVGISQHAGRHLRS